MDHQGFQYFGVGGVGLLTYRLARLLRLSASAALISVFLTEFSFLGFRSSIGTLTEPVFALIILAAILALHVKNYTICCALASLSTLARPEGLILLPGWVVILWVVHKRWRFSDLFLLAVFPLLWNLWGYSITNDLTFIVTHGYPIVTAPYGHGGWFDYPMGLVQYEPIVFPLAVLGLGLAVNRYQYCPLHILLALFFGFNVVVWRFGLFGTAGLLRYFVPVVPWLALYAGAAFDLSNLLLAHKGLAARGLNFLLVQVVFTVLVLNSHTAGYHLYNTPTVYPALIEAGEWIQTNRPDDYLYSSHPALLYYARRDFSSGAMVDSLAGLHRNGIVAVDRDFGSPELRRYLEHFQLLEELENFVFIYEYDLTLIEAQPTITFWTQEIQPYLWDGWSNVEEWGTWAVGSYSEMVLHFHDPRALTVTLSVIPHLVTGQQQSIEVYYNDAFVDRYEFPEGDQNAQQFSFCVPRSLVTGGLDIIRFVYGYAVSPLDLGVSIDGHQLAVGFLQMDLVPED